MHFIQEQCEMMRKLYKKPKRNFKESIYPLLKGIKKLEDLKTFILSFSNQWEIRTNSCIIFLLEIYQDFLYEPQKSEKEISELKQVLWYTEDALENNKLLKKFRNISGRKKNKSFRAFRAKCQARRVDELTPNQRLALEADVRILEEQIRKGDKLTGKPWAKLAQKHGVTTNGARNLQADRQYVKKGRKTKENWKIRSLTVLTNDERAALEKDIQELEYKRKPNGNLPKGACTKVAKKYRVSTQNIYTLLPKNQARSKIYRQREETKEKRRKYKKEYKEKCSEEKKEELKEKSRVQKKKYYETMGQRKLSDIPQRERKALEHDIQNILDKKSTKRLCDLSHEYDLKPGPINALAGRMRKFRWLSDLSVEELKQLEDEIKKIDDSRKEGKSVPRNTWVKIAQKYKMRVSCIHDLIPSKKSRKEKNRKKNNVRKSKRKYMRKYRKQLQGDQREKYLKKEAERKKHYKKTLGQRAISKIPKEERDTLEKEILKIMKDKTKKTCADLSREYNVCANSIRKRLYVLRQNQKPQDK